MQLQVVLGAANLALRSHQRCCHLANVPEPLAVCSSSFMTIAVTVFGARCYASAVYVVMRCLSVCLSVTFVYSVTTNKHLPKFFTVPQVVTLKSLVVRYAKDNSIAFDCMEL